MKQIPSSMESEPGNPIPGETNNTNPNNKFSRYLKEDRTDLDSLNKLRIEQTVGRKQLLIFCDIPLPISFLFKI